MKHEIGDLIRQRETSMDYSVCYKDLVWSVVKINPKTYTLKCVEGYLKGSKCKLVKNYCSCRYDTYGIRHSLIPILTRKDDKKLLEKMSKPKMEMGAR